MEKKICELKLNESKDVVGGLGGTVVVSAHTIPKPSSVPAVPRPTNTAMARALV